MAGHVYGGPDSNTKGVHASFKPYLEQLGNDSDFLFGTYLGDIVKFPTVENWDKIDSEIGSLFGKKIYFVAGNHDIRNRELYEKRYGKTYYSFDFKKNKFIILDGNLDHWNISGDQYSFFIQATKDLEGVDNLFIFSHQILWWSETNAYKNLTPNSRAGLDSISNYWVEIHPKLDSLDIPVYIFSGDVGAAHWASNYMYDRLDNVHLIATGMGENKGDNYVEISLAEGVATINFRFLEDGSTFQPDTFVINN